MYLFFVVDIGLKVAISFLNPRGDCIPPGERGGMCFAWLCRPSFLKLKEKYSLHVFLEKKRQDTSLLGWIIIPFPVFVYNTL